MVGMLRSEMGPVASLISTLGGSSPENLSVVLFQELQLSAILNSEFSIFSISLSLFQTVFLSVSLSFTQPRGLSQQ